MRKAFLLRAMHCVVCLALGHRAANAQAPGQSIRLVKWGDAKTDVLASPLTGVVLAVTAETNAVVVFDTSTVQATDSSGHTVHAAAVFAIGTTGSAIVPELPGGATVNQRPSTVSIGAEAFEAVGGDGTRTLFIIAMEHGAVQYRFKRQGEVQFALLFKESALKLTEVQVLGQKIKLVRAP